MTKKYFLLLLILPLCFAVYSIKLRSADGPYYNYGLSDPSYVYLINSLSMLQLKGVGHADHPGTPVQIAGAVIIRKVHFLFGEKKDLAEDVLTRPEFYMKSIDLFFIFLNSIALFIAGLIFYFAVRNIFAAFLFQLIPFVSINVTEVFSLVKPENFAFMLMAVFVSLLVKFVYEENISSRRYSVYIIVTGILAGLIVATKISFIGLLIIPLLLFAGFKNKIKFAATAFISFIVITIPAVSKTGYFIGWVKDLILHEERYGHGEDSVIDSASFISNVFKIFVNEKFLVITCIITAATLFMVFFARKNLSVIQKNESKFLFGIFLASALQIILVAKHYSHRYMFPVLILIIPALYFCIMFWQRRYFPVISPAKIFAGALAIVFIISAYNGRKLIARSKFRSNESAKISQFLNSNYPDAGIILSSGVTNEFTGLMLAFLYTPESAKEEYKRIIVSVHPGQIWYDVFRKKIFSLDKNANVYNMIAGKSPVLFQTTDEKFANVFIAVLQNEYGLKSAKLEKVFSNPNGEIIYKLDVGQ